ncbi:MAG: four helix bundle protein [Acidobacteria bacterium]|nr:four helix bundle protein [Acidobacteriota bacterium]
MTEKFYPNLFLTEVSNMKVKNYSELIVWQKAMDLVERIYEATREFPKEELYGLASQVRRAAVSIPSNIAEGQGRRSTNEFLHHLSYAHGSLREVETQILIAGRLGYLRQSNLDEVMRLSAEVGRLINGLANSLNH